MKKTLLLTFLFAGSVFTTNAQNSYSFESSEGFTLGDILEQNPNIGTFWETLTEVEDTAEITNEYASDGDYSIKIVNWDDMELGGASILNFVSYEKTSFAYDIYVPELGGSDSYFVIFDEDGVGTVLNFDYQGRIRLYNPITEIYSNIGTFEAEEWYSAEIKIDFTASTLVVFVNGIEIHSGEYYGSGSIAEEVNLAIDNFGTDAYFDNVVISNFATASTSDFLASSFSVYPNPVKDVLNISNTINAVINSATITDINGRTVKQTEGLEQINIADLNAGVYFVNINSTEGSLTKKIVKQ
jgi:hypothetical protein